MRSAPWLGTVAVAIALLAGCTGPTNPDTATRPPDTTTGTVFPSGIDTVPNAPPLLVTKPEEVRDIPSSDLPVQLRLNRGLLGLSEDEAKCVDTAIFDYLEGDGAGQAVDSEQTIAAFGGSILVCTGQERLAKFIAAKVRATNPVMTDDQAFCIEDEIAVADPAALALFLGAFTYADSGVPSLQEPFIKSFTDACALY